MTHSRGDTPSRVLTIMLRGIGGVSLLALPFVVAPYSWMNAIHMGLGMGELPSEPVVGYLTRSTSAFYALLGGLFLLLSRNPRRFRPVLMYLGVAVILFGVVLFCVDWIEGLPMVWRVIEGPFCVALGTAIFLLSRRLEDDGNWHS